ncbi:MULTISPECIES: hypothetical protein [unclassified Duganella]|jgi:hypothetical protein|uniref:hypothetical protein n=1 Tax=unclassified Duganella TaxID=2636909 RepID=UPI00087F9E27|nr:MULTISPECIES: hypothetical protein [unclassified Duganella]SDG53104.1 hypothetical protein SAMN05216320_105107 [Duganella sp. OV458]SDJ75933.1 hypothetical protein SAMN05428973_106108 [Duganella sp. OV510]
MNLQNRLNSLPLPASAIALLTALVLGTLDYQAAGWALFAAGVLAWVKLDSKQLLKSDRYGLPPALALLAYAALAGSNANIAVTFALAVHALVVFLILLSRHLSEDRTQVFSQQKGISQRI